MTRKEVYELKVKFIENKIEEIEEESNLIVYSMQVVGVEASLDADTDVLLNYQIGEDPLMVAGLNDYDFDIFGMTPYHIKE
jgi:hypothetical protein